MGQNCNIHEHSGAYTKIPGGLLIVPMLLAAIINTMLPSLFQIGDPTTALFTSKGTMVLIGMILFISGTQLDLSQLLVTLKEQVYYVLSVLE